MATGTQPVKDWQTVKQMLHDYAAINVELRNIERDAPLLYYQAEHDGCLPYYELCGTDKVRMRIISGHVAYIANLALHLAKYLNKEVVTTFNGRDIVAYPMDTLDSLQDRFMGRT